MEWINNLFVIIALVLGWGLSQWSEYFKDKKGDKKKLKRLLFNLLEIRYFLLMELNSHVLMSKISLLLKERYEDATGESLPDLDTDLTEFSKDVFRSNFDYSDKITLLGNNIDNILIEVSEIDPVFAYELSGQYNIKERLINFENAINSIEEVAGDMPKELADILEPSEWSHELMMSLDEFLLKLSKKINRKVNRQVKEKIEIQSLEPKDDNIKEWVNDFIEKLKLNIENSSE